MSDVLFFLSLSYSYPILTLDIDWFIGIMIIKNVLSATPLMS